jgi:hypothetical protein
MARSIRTGMRVRSVNRGEEIRYVVRSCAAMMHVGDQVTRDAGKLRSLRWVCYESLRDNTMHVLPLSEFQDGRFEEVPPAEA